MISPILLDASVAGSGRVITSNLAVHDLSMRPELVDGNLPHALLHTDDCLYTIDTLSPLASRTNLNHKNS